MKDDVVYVFFLLGLIFSFGFVSSAQAERCRYKITNYPECCLERECVYGIEEFTYLGIEKAAVQLRLTGRVSEEILKEKAEEVYKIVNASQYKKIFMEWYLPGMKLNKGAWATTHFMPEFKLTIREYMTDINPEKQ